MKKSMDFKYFLFVQLMLMKMDVMTKTKSRFFLIFFLIAFSCAKQDDSLLNDIQSLIVNIDNLSNKVTSIESSINQLESTQQSDNNQLNQLLETVSGLTNTVNNYLDTILVNNNKSQLNQDEIDSLNQSIANLNVCSSFKGH